MLLVVGILYLPLHFIIIIIAIVIIIIIMMMMIKLQD